MSDLQDHPEYRQLVNAVRAAPDDDLPRLVLADWLEEHDAPEWAEFIRVHCEAARHPHAARIWADTFTDADAVNPDWQPALTCARLVRELWPTVARMHFAEWNEGRMAYVDADGRCVFVHPHRTSTPPFEVRRGFVEQVGIASARWLGEGHHEPIGPLLVARQPVREVMLRDRECGSEAFSWFAYYDHDDIDTQVANWLPWCLARQLKGETSYHEATEEVPIRDVWQYADRDSAHAALSAAAIEWALEEAGRE